MYFWYFPVAERNEKKKYMRKKKNWCRTWMGYCPQAGLGTGRAGWARSRSAGTALGGRRARLGVLGRAGRACAQAGAGRTGAGRHGACMLGVLGAHGRRA